MPATIPNRTARRAFLALQGLCEAPHRGQSKEDLSEAIRRLGFVQIDSINTVARAHHQILFSRNATYREHRLKALVEKDRALFEHWTHDASIIPSELYCYWKHRFAREERRLQERYEAWQGSPFLHECDGILERIARDGPVMARDFGGTKPSTGWWDWHPSKTALEYLWRTGKLAIARREGFQKVYDLAERVIPADCHGAEVEHHEFVDWACRSALERLGFATRGEIAGFWDLLKPAEVEAWIAENESGLETVMIECADGSKPRAALRFRDSPELLDNPPEPPDRVRVLSPFDPVLRDRKRAERLFGFSYRIEIFVPEERRVYGYYVFPVLRGDRMVGRIDMKADRNRDVLAVRRFWPEKGTRMSKAFLADLDAELDRIRRFSGVAGIEHAGDWLGAG
ncbi:winged helix-turn-helix domain-containing protein [Oricola thermophila]|uniref:Winged helix-turn-helix domain-containing protein n=1 Tax=Oricola thermophila TaxID=2742145 RepID=A0A6N1VHN6_9HYPH|nr:winged helix-turn-helix domain-containing protein [Oricola thermophila]QKV19943.1 winged helix-turn-helix domain-containing protein [Oricola thermophila]